MKQTLLLCAIGCVLVSLLYVLSCGNGARGFCSRESAWDPPQIISSVLTPEECRYIIDKATPLFTRSTTVGSSTPSETRTSETAWLTKDDPVARKILEKAVELTGKPIENCENLQVVRYQPGTYYRAHHDACCDGTQACLDFDRDGGQRVGTLLVYLNSEFTDGETHFPDHDDLKMKADPGSAIFFRPLGTDEPMCHPKALHAGLPISSGVKYVCNAWVRENKFR